MPKFKVNATVTVPFTKSIECDNEEEARKLADMRELADAHATIGRELGRYAAQEAAAGVRPFYGIGEEDKRS